MEDITEMLEPIHHCLREILANEQAGKTATGYTDSDVIAVSLLYAHILGSRLVDNLTEEKASIGLSKHLAELFATNISLVTKQMSGVDLNNYYGKTNKKMKG